MVSFDIVAKTMEERRKKHEMEGKIPVCDLPVGKFANLNGSIIYRHESVKNSGGWLPGCWMIEKHNHKTPYDELIALEQGDHSLHGWEYYVTPIDVPEKKHVDNTIAHLKDDCKKGFVTGLQYVEHYERLREYLKPYAKKKDNL